MILGSEDISKWQAKLALLHATAKQVIQHIFTVMQLTKLVLFNTFLGLSSFAFAWALGMQGKILGGNLKYLPQSLTTS